MRQPSTNCSRSSHNATPESDTFSSFRSYYSSDLYQYAPRRQCQIRTLSGRDGHRSPEPPGPDVGAGTKVSKIRMELLDADDVAQCQAVSVELAFHKIDDHFRFQDGRGASRSVEPRSIQLAVQLS